MKKKLKEGEGFSLIEVLVFITILGVFFVTAASITLISLRNMKINEHKIIASRYQDELLSWLRSEKEADWKKFINYYVSGSTYCFNVTPPTAWGSLDACTDYRLSPAIFKRQAVLTNIGTPVTQVDVNITISWNELGSSQSISTNTVFTLWE